MYNPYLEPATNHIYDMLFCDSINAYKNNVKPPFSDLWDVLFTGNPEEADLLQIINKPETESRVKLLAHLLLRQSNFKNPSKELLGVIIELGLEGGLDVLASYRDGTARYINYTGAMIIWESPNAETNVLTENIFAESAKIVSQIGPWHKPRRPHPAPDTLRISFLVSDGLYFGEGPINTMFNDSFSAPVLQACTAMMQFLTSR